MKTILIIDDEPAARYGMHLAMNVKYAFQPCAPELVL